MGGIIMEKEMLKELSTKYNKKEKLICIMFQQAKIENYKTQEFIAVLEEFYCY